MLKRKLVMALTAAVGLGAAGNAHASMQFCNGTSVTIWTTYMWREPSCTAEDGSGWRKRGWWSLAPGQCKIVFAPSLPYRWSYFYAEGGGLVWSGSTNTCIQPSIFDSCGNFCDANSRIVAHREVDTGGSLNYTLTFTP